MRDGVGALVGTLASPIAHHTTRIGAGARTRVKICGITRVEDGLAAAAAGADAIGLNFFAPSPRCVDIDEAATIRQSLPPFVTVVGLFVNAPEESVAQVVERVDLELLQFHGDETPADCERFGLPYMKAVRVHETLDMRAASQRYASACALLLDAHDDKLWGGSGRTFDWKLVPADMALPIVLAGGLTPANVADAVKGLRPYGVDVSGGVEQSPGIKDAAKITKFIEEVQRATIAQRSG